MPFSAVYGQLNVEATLNKFFQTGISSYGVPSWMTWLSGSNNKPPRTINFDMPEQPLNTPSFGITHIGNQPMPGLGFQGDIGGTGNSVLHGEHRICQVEIDCWVLNQITGVMNPNWMMQLRTMRDMVVNLIHQNRLVKLQDFTTPATPTTVTGAAIRFIKVEETQTAPDPNPAVKRKRLIATYEYTERWV